MRWYWGRQRQAAARFERPFREARRQFDLEVRAIFARHAADGLLKSGKTIKVVVRALDDATLAAVTDALAGIAAVTDHAGTGRKYMLAELEEQLLKHHVYIRDAAREPITRIGLGSDFKHAVPLIEAAAGRHREKIADFREGWTAPAGKPWKDRHPFAFAIILAVIGIAVGWAGKAIWDDQSSAPVAAAKR